MPIGAVVGTAVVGAGAQVVSSSKASKATKQAANKASDTSLEVANQNNTLARETYAKNEAHLNPFIDRGNTAGDAIMSLLLGDAPSAPAPAPSQGSTGAQTNPGSRVSPVPADTAPQVLEPAIGGSALSPAVRAFRMGDEPLALRSGGPGSFDTGSTVQSALSGAALPQATATQAPGTVTAPAATATPAPETGSALDAFDRFRNSTNYQFRLNQGLDAVGTKFAAAGAFESGAEKKAINDYAQNFASNELANYMDRLFQQESLGAQSASALAGVGTSMVAQVSSNNRAAGDAAANAALVAGQASANNFNNIGSAISGAAGTIGGALASSYRPTGYYGPPTDYGYYHATGAIGM